MQIAGTQQPPHAHRLGQMPLCVLGLSLAAQLLNARLQQPGATVLTASSCLQGGGGDRRAARQVALVAQGPSGAEAPQPAAAGDRQGYHDLCCWLRCQGAGELLALLNSQARCKLQEQESPGTQLKQPSLPLLGTHRGIMIFAAGSAAKEQVKFFHCAGI